MSLAEDIRGAINRHSRENVSNTPDFILAAFLLECLEAYEKAIGKKRPQKPRWIECASKDGYTVCPYASPDDKLPPYVGSNYCQRCVDFREYDGISVLCAHP